MLGIFLLTFAWNDSHENYQISTKSSFWGIAYLTIYLWHRGPNTMTVEEADTDVALLPIQRNGKIL